MEFSAEAIRARTRTVGECWVWTGAIQSNGYGRFRARIDGVSSNHYAHRASYQLSVGPIPEGLDLDHLCRNRACCNPAHLEPVSRAENIRRGQGPELLSRVNGAKAKCVNGHVFDESNTYMRPGGGRTCRACRLIRSRRYGRNQQMNSLQGAS